MERAKRGRCTSRGTNRRKEPSLRVLVCLAVAALIVAGTTQATTADRPRARLLERPTGLVAGEPWVAQVELRRDGRALAGARPSFWITSGSTSRAFRATQAGRGRYRARVVFPAPGAWRYGVAALGARIALGRATVLPRPAEVEEPFAVAVAPDGRVAIVDRAGGRVLLLSDRGATVAANGLTSPISVGFDPRGGLYVGDETSIYRVDPGGLARVAGNGTRGFAGDGGPAAAAGLGLPTAFSFDQAGRMYIAEYDGRIRLVGTRRRDRDDRRQRDGGARR